VIEAHHLGAYGSLPQRLAVNATLSLAAHAQVALKLSTFHLVSTAIYCARNNYFRSRLSHHGTFDAWVTDHAYNAIYQRQYCDMVSGLDIPHYVSFTSGCEVRYASEISIG
jgi:hypothetical protein